MYAILVIIAGSFGYFYVVLPCKIILDISKGKAFIAKNVQRFNFMAVILLVYAILFILSPYLFKLIYHTLIPNEFMLPPFVTTLQKLLPVCLIAIGLFIIGKAFEKGYNLQRENALTI